MHARAAWSSALSAAASSAAKPRLAETAEGLGAEAG